MNIRGEECLAMGDYKNRAQLLSPTSLPSSDPSVLPRLQLFLVALLQIH
jgi:hypothetical protein